MLYVFNMMLGVKILSGEIIHYITSLGEIQVRVNNTHQRMRNTFIIQNPYYTLHKDWGERSTSAPPHLLLFLQFGGVWQSECKIESVKVKHFQSLLVFV